MIVGDCNDIPSAAEIVERTVQEAKAVFDAMKLQFEDE
jgi:hypothetical protein